MEIWAWVLCGALLIAVITLAVKLRLMQKSADEIAAAFSQRLSEDTNALIDISSRDRHLRALASQLNAQLRILRDERRRFKQGDFELKAAVTNISHDLRTPLTAISGYLELLEREEKTKQTERYLAIIRERTEALKALTQELFRFSVIASTSDELNIARVNVSGALEESLAGFYAALTQRGIEPMVALPEKPVYRELDRDALMRILSNLINNALKYSDGDLAVTMGESGDISFSNAAAGLDAVSVQRLFDRFYTVETGRSATGLGLSIAKLLTERMGGTIAAAYADGRLTVSLSFAQSDT